MKNKKQIAYINGVAINFEQYQKEQELKTNITNRIKVLRALGSEKKSIAQKQDTEKQELRKLQKEFFGVAEDE